MLITRNTSWCWLFACEINLVVSSINGATGCLQNVNAGEELGITSPIPALAFDVLQWSTVRDVISWGKLCIALNVHPYICQLIKLYVVNSYTKHVPRVSCNNSLKLCSFAFIYILLSYRCNFHFQSPQFASALNQLPNEVL